ncbi:hypothetical protein [Pseudomonas brassicacearum]|uniref:hypothetical protein n=1 Tax=Pseudomonas brassicacearum TaxID=930166 RepID=UPI0011CDD61F|nr:hypothetical protein [Pseudomonas brassicacearum]
MALIGCVIPVLAATVRLSRLARKDAPVLGLLDAWARIYPTKRLALKAIELIVHDRLERGQ